MRGEFRVVTPQFIPLDDGAHAEIHKYGNLTLKSDGPIYLGLHDIVELARRAAGSDHELLSVLSTVMKRGHRFSDYEEVEIDDDESF